MRILLTGSSGQLGTELRLLLPESGNVTSADITPPHGHCEDFRELDFRDLNAVSALLEEVRPDVIVNAAAYTQVDQAESDMELATLVNAKAPGVLADWASRNNSLLVHYSTDYVFDGTSEVPYRESDPTSPVNAYGESKLAGEQAVAKSGCSHVILRTSWIYSSHGANFLLTMLRLANERSHLGVINDQFGCPTWARNLASVTSVIVERYKRSLGSGSPEGTANGLYHYCDTPPCTWYDFAKSIFESAAAVGLLENIPSVEAITSDQYKTAARRPKFSVLDTRRIEKDLRIEPASVQESVMACLQDLQGRN